MMRRMMNERAMEGHWPVARFRDKIKTSPLSTKNRDTAAVPLAGNRRAFVTTAWRSDKSRKAVAQRSSAPPV